MPYTESETFSKQEYSTKPLPAGEYEDCTFQGCNFSGSLIKNIKFNDCQFTDCNLSQARLSGVALRTVHFKNCQLMNLSFEYADDFGLALTFDHCLLDSASFFKKKLKGVRFTNCRLKLVDFIETDLTSAIFDNCDLDAARFDRTILEKASLSSSYNYIIDPAINRIKKARFSLQGLPGLLVQHDIVVE